jgi:outer membrane protein assembly factor BamD (BamD/ComL family)
VVTDAATDAWVRDRARQEEKAAKLMARAASYRERGKSSEALSTYGLVVRRYPRARAAAQAQFARARLLSDNHEYRKAFDAYQALIDHFRDAGLFAEALAGQMLVAERVFDQHQRDTRHGKKRPESELPDLETLARMFANVVSNGRYSDVAPRAQYLHAVSLEMSGAPLGAQAAHSEFLQRYPGHPLADDAAFQHAYIDFKANENAPVPDTARWTAASLGLAEFLHDFPQSDRAPVARELLHRVADAERNHLLDQARLYEKLGKPEAATRLYREASVSGSDPSQREGTAPD